MTPPGWLSLRVKVGLILFAVVAGALAIVYVAVIPQLESRLVDAKIDDLRDVATRPVAVVVSRQENTDRPPEPGHQPQRGV